MGEISPGPYMGQPRKPRKQTQTEKSHRYEPFSKRVAKLKIDPVHQVQKSRLRESLNDLSQSYFRTALEEWSELNLTATFTSLLKSVNPLCESLPQLLHHADTIVDVLLLHISKEDPLALEAMLGLVAQLAHDLGQEFEKYFAKTVALVAKVSTTQDDPAVIESCFTCLTWIYKYLSKLLVHDLQPLLNIVLPYFASRKEHIRRFMAESLAFLLRKAAVLYQRNDKPLCAAIRCILSRVADGNAAESSTLEASMVLLAESAVGIDGGLHSSAPSLFQCLFREAVAVSSPPPNAVILLVQGVTINLIHSTNAIGFEPWLNAILDQSKAKEMEIQSRYLLARLVLTVSASRDGSRIEQWNGILSFTEDALLILKQEHEICDSNDAKVTLCKLVAVIIQNAPLNQILSAIPALVQKMICISEPRLFFTFNEMVAQLGKPKFQDLVLPHLQQYIMSNWSGDEAGLTVLVHDLSQLDSIRNRPVKSTNLSIPDEWEMYRSKSWRSRLFEESTGYIDILLSRACHFPRSRVVSRDWQQQLQEALDAALDDTSQQADTATRIALGWGLGTLTQLSKDTIVLNSDRWLKIAALPDDRFRILPFIAAATNHANAQGSVEANEPTKDLISEKLVPNMLGSSSELRKTSLELIQSIHRIDADSWVTPLTDLLLETINTPYTISNARQIAMLVRRLPLIHKTVPENHPLSRLVPFFCLGLLSDYHDQLQRDVCTALGQTLTTIRLEESVVEVVNGWLQASSATKLEIRGESISSSSTKHSSYECTKLDHVDRLALATTEIFNRPDQEITNLVEGAHALLQQTLPKQNRTTALQVLQYIPQVAEKRSRIVVPPFLAAQRERSGHDVSLIDESNSVHTVVPEIEASGWILQDRRSFLKLLNLFNNPRTLYRSEEVHGVLLELLSNGDGETRKLSLLALMKWKNQIWLTYQDHLVQVAEDKSTTSELGSMLHTDQDASAIKAEDRGSILPVLLRLIFGLLVSRVGVRGSQEAKRKSLLRLVFRMNEADVNIFLEILLGKFKNIDLSKSNSHRMQILSQDVVSLDQQYGFLRMVHSMLEILQTQFYSFGDKIIDAVLYCTLRASKQVNALNDTDSTPALLRSVRRVGIQCLNSIFDFCPQLNLAQYLDLIYQSIIQPRLDKFVSENGHGVSTLLQTFAIWAKSGKSFEYLLFDGNRVLEKLWDLLTYDNAKSEVKNFVLEEIVGRGLDLTDNTTEANSVVSETFLSQASIILDSISKLLQQNPPKQLLLTAAKVVERLAGFVTSSEVKSKVAELLAVLLKEPTQRLAPHIKAQILKALLTIARELDSTRLHSLRTVFFHLLASYLNFFKDLPNRQICVQLMKLLAADASELQKGVEICAGLNAQSKVSLDEVDHESQAEAFSDIHTLVEESPDLRSMIPVLHNLIYCIRSSSETAVRGNALSCLKHLVKSSITTKGDWQDLQRILLTAIQKHVRDDSELVRADFVELLGSVVQFWQCLPISKELQPLLVGNDEEASIFVNILHIQQHRRTRAIRRLITEVEQGDISSQTVSQFLLPLLQKFVEDESNDITTQNAKGQSLASMNVILQWLDWKTFRTVFRHYKQSLDQKVAEEKIDTRLLSHAAQALTMAIQSQQSSGLLTSPLPHLATSLPSPDVIANELKLNFIPKLAELSRYKDEGEISQRIPAAVVAIKLIKLLPESEHALLASPVVLDVAQILRSRTQETRDLARNNLAKIVSILGPSSMRFVLKELRTTLTKGYQLHVLSYTLHTILLVTADTRIIGDLDYCVEDMVKIILDDVFGAVGDEKNNKDYTSGMREVKGNKSFDSIEILARSTRVHNLGKLILPFEALLAGALTSRQIRHIDELFRRVGIGISHGSDAGSQDLLILAFQLIQAFYRSKPAQLPKHQTNDDKNRERFLIQMSSTEKAERPSSASLMYKIAKFAIDIARSTFARHSELLTPENVHGFVPIIGDALIEAQEDVQISAMRLLTTVIKLKIPEFDENSALYVMEAVKIVKSAVNTNDEIAQAALKLVSAIVREKQNAQIRDSDIAYLLKRTLPDLQEPDRQGVTFNLVKAVMARQLQIPEIYELVDQLGLMMVTSQNRNSRDAARGVYVHFLLDYPQGKTRWSKQIKFMVKNLEYQHPEGRESVMEAISILLNKVDKGILKDLAAALFIPIVLRMAKDENVRCRELAGALLSQLFRKVSTEFLPGMLQPLQAWLEQRENAVLLKVSLQAWSILLKTVPIEGETFMDILLHSVADIMAAENLLDEDWEIKYHALEVTKILVQEFPQQLLSPKQQKLWVDVISMLSTSQTWLQEAAGTLLELLFNDLHQSDAISIPMKCSHGLKVGEDEVLRILKSSMKIVKSPYSSNELAKITLHNLLFIGRIIADNRTQITVRDHESDTVGNGRGDDSEAEVELGSSKDKVSISAVQYLIDQVTYTLRREPTKYTSSSLRPKINFSLFLATYIPTLSAKILADLGPAITSLLVPLLYITSPATPTPRSVDSIFTETYTQLIESAQAVLDAVQNKTGDKQYMVHVTAATKIAREKRQERRNKRAIDTVAQPERAAREKRKKFEKKKERRKEVKGIHRSLRRKDLGF